KPIPYAVLKVQFRRLVGQHDKENKGAIYTKDLLSLIHHYENENNVVLLTEDQKKAIESYCLCNPDLEMTADDILHLIRLIFSPSPVSSISAPTRHTGLSYSTVSYRPPLLSDGSKTTFPPKHKSTPWKRSLSKARSLPKQPMDLVETESEDPLLETIPLRERIRERIHERTRERIHERIDESIDEKMSESIPEEEVSGTAFAGYYTRSMELTRRLKSSERSLASMTRDNEERIVQLQNRVDEMTQEVIKQKKEMSEYKGKEKNSLYQITALETHIAKIQCSETNQKQVYQSMKRLFDDKCEEAHKLQDLLRQKELDLKKTEKFLGSFQFEFELLNQERNRLLGMQKELELELETSHQTHMQLAEQRSENERLRSIIGTLKDDLDEARNTHGMEDLLEMEMEASSIKVSEQDSPSAEPSRFIHYENSYYPSTATEAAVDLARDKEELNQLKLALDCENQSLVSELADLRMKLPDRLYAQESLLEDRKRDAQMAMVPSLPSLPVVSSIALRTVNETTIEMNVPPPTDVWTQSRVRQRKFDKGKKSRGNSPSTCLYSYSYSYIFIYIGVQDLNGVS
ncbi:hypothetical protein BDF14DRAFT_1727826, partial [Spinellus fusiger]